MNSYFSEEELAQIGFKSYGTNVFISRKASIYSASSIVIGNHVRVDDFCILSGEISIGNYVHLNPYIGVFAGTAGVTLEDFVNLSSKITIYALSDDYTGETLTSPLLPATRKNIKMAPVILKRYVIIGTGTSILPGVTIGEGSAIGAMSLVRKDTEPWGIYAGNPLRFLKTRSKNLLNFLPND